MEPLVLEAYTTMVRTHRCSSEDIVIVPALRREFLRLCICGTTDDAREEHLLRVLNRLRKHSKLPRSRDLLEDSGTAL